MFTAHLVKQYVKNIVWDVIPVGRWHDNVRCLRKKLNVLPRIALNIVQEVREPLPRLTADGVHILCPPAIYELR